MTSFAIQNFGCRVNQAEAFSWAEEFEFAGLRLEGDSARADIVVVNTCTLTAQADRDVRKFIRKIARANPAARLIIAGCSVDGGKIDGAKIPQAWMTFSNEEKENLARHVLGGVSRSAGPAFRPWRSRALLKIQDGCDLGCTFCLIPSVRGKSRSLEKEKIFRRAARFARQGFREIVVCGIHLSSYGQDLRPKSSLLELLQELTALEEMPRLRLSSLDPRFSTDELLGFIARSPKICPHFHLSLQHGSDRILGLMGRKSRVSEYARILARLRRGSPSAALGADLISGFPGESDEDFSKMYDFLEASPLNYLHVFAFSPRPGTPAQTWPQVREAIKHERSAKLRRLSEQKRLAFRLSFLGRNLDGIVVKKNELSAEILTGNYIDVLVPSCPQRPGEAVKVKITRAEANETWGEMA